MEEESRTDLISSTVEEKASVITSGSMLGTVKKWINFIHGWQPRRLLLTDSYIAYYKSEYDFIENIGGKILDLNHLHVIQHPLDTCRFDIMTRSGVNKSIWFLRSSSTEECRLWIDMIGRRQRTLEVGDEETGSSLLGRGSRSTSVSRQPSLLSNGGRSTASGASFTRVHDLRTQTGQMETFQENMGQALTVVENFFTTYSTDLNNLVSHSENGDLPQSSSPREPLAAGAAEESADLIKRITTSSGSGGGRKRPRHISETSESSDESDQSIGSKEIPHEYKPLSELSYDTFDFVGASHSFKTNSEGYMACLNYCIDLINQREQSWRLRIQTEVERRREAEAFVAHAQTKLDEAGACSRMVCMPSPDHEEGPDCTMEEEEFFDCVEVQLDLWEQKDDLRQALLASFAANNLEQSKPVDPVSQPVPEDPIFTMIRDEIKAVMDDTMKNISSLENAGQEKGKTNSSGVDEFKSKWSQLADSGGVRVYESLESEEPGMVITPLLATGVVQGATGREMTERFWDGQYRREWEHTIDTPPFLIKKMDSNTVIYYQSYKRIWPTAQRYALFWSSRVRVNKTQWIVINRSLNPAWARQLLSRYQGTLLSELNGLVLATIRVSMLCKTTVACKKSVNITPRQQVSCRVIYYGSINPGGWAPASVLKTVYRREYPRFVSLFTAYVVQIFSKAPVNLDDL